MLLLLAEKMKRVREKYFLSMALLPRKGDPKKEKKKKANSASVEDKEAAVRDLPTYLSQA